MRINPISLASSNIHRVNFNARNDDDEYVYVPLIWDKEDYDSVEFSNKPQNSQNSIPLAGTDTAPKKGSKFKKIATGAAGAFGTVTLLPEGVKKVATSVEDAAVSTKDSINNTIDAFAEVKDHVRELKNKDKTEQDTTNEHPQEQQTSAGTDSAPVIAGETPVADHSDFDRRFQKDDEPEDELDAYDDEPELEDMSLDG